MSQAEGVMKFIRESHAGASDSPDAELVGRFAASGDEQAFRALVSRYGPVVWAVCRRLVRNHHDAEDAFQTTFLVFAKKAGGLRTGAAVGGWLYSTAYRVASRVRSSRRDEPTDAEPSAGLPNGALDELTVREAEVALHEELARLPEKYRDPLVLCCLEGLSRDEAAARLGWSVNRVKHGLEQGRERLRSRLNRRGIALGVPLLTGLLATPASAVPVSLVEAAIRHATGTAAPTTISSLVDGVTRTMWLSKWKWTVAGCAAFVLTTGGTLAALWRESPELPAPAAKPEFAFVPVAVPEPVKPAPAPEPKKVPPKPAWDVAAEYLQLIIDGKLDEAKKLGDGLADRYPREIQTAGLKRVKLAMILVNDARVMVATERAKLKRRPNAEANDEHVVVMLERKNAAAPWKVRENDVADEKKVLREVDNYLEGKFKFDEDKLGGPLPAPPKQPWNAALEFLKLALAEKTADAIKLTVPGTISENKVSEIKKVGFKSVKPVVVLLNDTRIEVAFEGPVEEKGELRHLVLMLTKSRDGAWQVKDIDAREPKSVEERVQFYLTGRYNEREKK